MSWLSLPVAVFALSRYLSVVLALWVAFALNLPNPWWAMLTVFLAQPTQPLVGAIWAKAWYRVAGTVIGCVASILLIPHVSDTAELLILCVAGWISLCVVGALLDRSPRSYLFMLAGYTLALVGLPAATAPAGIFDIAVARSEEIVIGVLASALVQSLLLPRSVASAMHQKLESILGDMRAWIGAGLRLETPAPAPRHLATQLTEVNLLATDWRFEGSFPASTRDAFRALEERLVAILPLMAAIEDLLKATSAIEAPADRIQPLLDRITRWVSEDVLSRERSDLIVAELQAAAPSLGPDATWSDILVATLVRRLSELAAAWEACLGLEEAIRGQAGAPGEIRQPQPRARTRSLHIDFADALRPGATVAATIVIGGVLTVLTRWESGPLAIGIASVTCALFAASDNPVPIARTFLTGFLIALPLALIYAYAVLPLIDGFVMLAAALFPIVFVIGLLLAQPRFAVLALTVIVGFTGGLALQPSFTPNFAVFVNTYLALLGGAVLALVGLGLGWILPIHGIIQRILRAGWRDLAALCADRLPSSSSAWSSRMLDRAGLLIPRLARATPEDKWSGLDALRDLRLGAAIIELRRLGGASAPGPDREIEALLAGLGAHYRALSRGQDAALPADLVAPLDGAIGGLLQLGEMADRQAGVAAAAGLRRTLFPQAPAYAPATAQA